MIGGNRKTKEERKKKEVRAWGHCKILAACRYVVTRERGKREKERREGEERKRKGERRERGRGRGKN